MFYRFEEMQLEDHETCSYDVITIHDGDSASSRKLDTLCGNQLPTKVYQSTSNKMLITFKTDHNKDFSGFSGGFHDVPGK